MRSNGADEEGRDGLKKCTRKASRQTAYGTSPETDNKSVPVGLEEETESKLGGK